MGYSTWGHIESNVTEGLSTHTNMNGFISVLSNVLNTAPTFFKHSTGKDAYISTAYWGHEEGCLDCVCPSFMERTKFCSPVTGWGTWTSYLASELLFPQQYGDGKLLQDLGGLAVMIANIYNPY